MGRDTGDAGSAACDEAASSSERGRAPDVLHLEAIAGPCAGAVLTRPGELLTVGRTSKSKVHIRDAAVSERHAQLAWEGGRWLLRDVGSSNGTAVNGRQVAEGEAVALKDGDTILFGTATEITSAVDEALAVEQDLRSECERLIERLTAQGEQMANSLQRQWQAARAALQTVE